MIEIEPQGIGYSSFKLPKKAVSKTQKSNAQQTKVYQVLISLKNDIKNIY